MLKLRPRHRQESVVEGILAKGQRSLRVNDYILSVTFRVRVQCVPSPLPPSPFSLFSFPLLSLSLYFTLLSIYFLSSLSLPSPTSVLFPPIRPPTSSSFPLISPSSSSSPHRYAHCSPPFPFSIIPFPLSPPLLPLPPPLPNPPLIASRLSPSPFPLPP